VSRHRDVLDTQPGSVPEIREDVDGLTFIMHLSGALKGKTFVVRTDDAGDIWIAIAAESSTDEGE
jgi:hypothetical protein